MANHICGEDPLHLRYLNTSASETRSANEALCTATAKGPRFFSDESIEKFVQLEGDVPWVFSILGQYIYQVTVHVFRYQIVRSSFRTGATGMSSGVA
jgi:hypothetical protein